jgi:hypothetical protein
MESEKEKETKEQNSRTREREVEVRMKEVLERDKRRMNVVVMGVPEVDEENDKVVINTVIRELVEEMHIGCEVMGKIGKKATK